MTELLPALADHLQLSLIALAVGCAIGLPLAVFLVWVRSLRGPVLAVVGVLQTIPSLALLALMVPVLVAVGPFLKRTIGVDVPALGFAPAVLALTIYSLLPILRNAVTGLLGVDPLLTEVARGLGMTRRQVLWKVELPLAAPVILAGIRTAAVWVVGTATLATPVGQRCLGDLIFRGLQLRDWSSVLLGCAAAAVLAVALDTLLGLIESAVRLRERIRLGAGVGGLAVLAALAWSGPLWIGGDRTDAIRVGSKTFTEQYILAQVLSDALKDAGLPSEVRSGLGSTVVFDALAGGDLDVYVDYSGTLWATVLKRDDIPERAVLLDELTKTLRQDRGVEVLGALGFENAYVLAMRRDRAEALGIRSIADLAGKSPDLTIAADYEFLGRPEWRAIRDAYGLRFAKTQTLDPTFLYDAARNGTADVISAYTTDGRIAAFDLVVLDDPKQAVPPYDAVLLLSRQTAARPDVVAALKPLVGSITADAMRRANGLVDQDRKSVEDAARQLRASGD